MPLYINKLKDEYELNQEQTNILESCEGFTDNKLTIEEIKYRSGSDKSEDEIREILERLMYCNFIEYAPEKATRFIFNNNFMRVI